MKLKYLTLVALAALLLSACSSAAEPTATQAPPTAAQPTATATAAPEETATVPPATATESSSVATATPESTEATDTPEPADVFAFLQVGPDEWVRGPADAPVTIIEYADFQ